MVFELIENNFVGVVITSFLILFVLTNNNIVDIEKFYSLMKQEGVVYRGFDSDTAWGTRLFGICEDA